MDRSDHRDSESSMSRSKGSVVQLLGQHRSVRRQELPDQTIEELEEQKIKRKMTIASKDRNMNVMWSCGQCIKDFGVVFCPHHDQFYCESCDHLLHQFGEERNHIRCKPQPKPSPLAEAGYAVRVNLMDVYIVSIIIIIFLIYPSLLKEIAQMLNCTDEICTSIGVCHKYLEEDPRIDCSKSTYSSFRLLSYAFFTAYGIGIPLVGYIMLRRRRLVLKTKKVINTLGFLYSGYRESKYYWEMLTLVRKMLLVFIVVFVNKYPKNQLYLAMWLITVCVFLNIFLKPFKYSILWKLENLSLISFMVTLNIGLVFFEELSSSVKPIISFSVFSVNVAILLVFLFCIIREVKCELYEAIDADGDGQITCMEFQEYWSSRWNDYKPRYFKSSRQQAEEIKDKDRMSKWKGIDAIQCPRHHTTAMGPYALMGYWLNFHQEKSGMRTNRFEWIESQRDGNRVKTRPRVRELNEEEQIGYWKHSYNFETDPNAEDDEEMRTIALTQDTTESSTYSESKNLLG